MNVSSENQIAIFPADVNGDGLMDLVQITQNSSSGLTLQSFLSKADGTFTALTPAVFPDILINADSFLPLGLYGGSSTNILSCWRDENSSTLNLSVFSATSTGAFKHTTDIHTQNKFPKLTFSIGDCTGNGKADLLYQFIDEQSFSCVWPLLSGTKYPDLLSSLTDQLGNTISIEYQPLSNTDVYSTTAAKPVQTSPALRYPCRLSPTQFPLQEVLGQAIYVVASYSISNNQQRNRFNYSRRYELKYCNGLIDLTGRGWLGFETVSLYNPKNGKKVLTTYNQGFPFTSTIASRQIFRKVQTATDKETKAPASYDLLKSSFYFYQSHKPDSPTPAQTLTEVRVTGKLRYHYTYLESKFDYLLAESYAYDTYGNRSQHIWWGYIKPINPDSLNSIGAFPAVTPCTDTEVTYAYSQFQNDTSADNWVLGRCLYSKKTSNPNDQDITEFAAGDFHLLTYTYNPQTYTCASHAMWDSGNKCFIKTDYTYDRYGNRLTKTRPGNLVTEYAYETRYNQYLSRKTVSAPSTEPLVYYYGYDPRFGTNVAHQDANGYGWITTLDGFGRVITKQGPIPDNCTQQDNNQVTPLVTGDTTFSSFKVLTLQTTAYLADNSGNIYQRVNTLQEFPSAQNRFFSWKSAYVDGLGRRCLAARETGETAKFALVNYIYNSTGKLSQKSLPFFSSDLNDFSAARYIEYTYDTLNRVTSITKPTGAAGAEKTICTYEYLEAGQTVITQASGKAEQYTQTLTHHYFDGKPQVISATTQDAEDSKMNYNFDPLGRMICATDSIGISNTFSYDSLNRKISQDNPDQNTTGDTAIHAFTYKYDAITGKIISRTDAANAQTIFAYDGLGRLTTKTFSDQSRISYEYDNAQNGKSKLASVSAAPQDPQDSFSKHFAYDPYGNLTAKTIEFPASAEQYVFQNSYDPRGRLLSRIYPDSSRLQRKYGVSGLISQSSSDLEIQYPDNLYSPGGKFTAKTILSTQAPILTFNYVYNPGNQLYAEQITTHKTQPATILQYSYTYDFLNQLQHVQDELKQSTDAFTYRDKRLTRATIPVFSSKAIDYNYNKAGNIIQKGNYTYTYNAHFPISMKSTEQEIYSATQDPCGRTQKITKDNLTQTFEYDGAGNLFKVTDNNDLLRRYSYDEKGQRLKETLADGSSILYLSADYFIRKSPTDATTTEINKYISDKSGLTAAIKTTGSNNEINYFRHNHKGNITHLFAEDGELLSDSCYDAFGNYKSLAGSPTLPKYESRFLDTATGLYYFGARYYNPLTGTFLTPDSTLGTHNYLHPLAWNRFAFELNNPINYQDPTGHWSSRDTSWLIDAALVAAAVVATPLAPAIAVGFAAGAAAGFITSATTTGNSISWQKYERNVGIGFGVGVAVTAVVASSLFGGEFVGGGIAAEGITEGAAEGASEGIIESAAEDSEIISPIANVQTSESIELATEAEPTVGTTNFPSSLFNQSSDTVESLEPEDEYYPDDFENESSASTVSTESGVETAYESESESSASTVSTESGVETVSDDDSIGDGDEPRPDM